MSERKGREVLETFPHNAAGSLAANEARFAYARMIVESGAQDRMGVGVGVSRNEVGSPVYEVYYVFYR